MSGARGARAVTRVVQIASLALVFLAGGLMVPRLVDATVSSGERAAFFPVTPARILSTTAGPSPLPVGTRLGPGQTIDVQVRGVGGVPANASAVVMNVTAIFPSATSHLTIWPTGEALPGTSSLNYGPGQVIPNLVTVKIGAAGKVSFRNNAGNVDVLADVNGYYEDHDHDDRYDTKAQVNTKIDNAQAESDYVGTEQLDDGGVDLVDMRDLTSTVSVFPAMPQVITAGHCETIATGAFATPATGMYTVSLKEASNGAVWNSGLVLPMQAQSLNGGGPKVLACNGTDVNISLPAGTYRFDIGMFNP
jgi:hypothetical protein